MEFRLLLSVMLSTFSFAAEPSPENENVRCTIQKTVETYRDGQSVKLETTTVAEALKPVRKESEDHAIRTYELKFANGEVEFFYGWSWEGTLDLSVRSAAGVAVRTYGSVAPEALASAAAKVAQHREEIRDLCRAYHTPDGLCGPPVGKIRLQLRANDRRNGEDVHVEATCLVQVR